MSKAKPRSSSAVDTEIEIDRQATVVQDRHTSRGIFPTLPLAQLCEKCRGVADNLDDYLLKRGNNPSPTKKLIRHHKDVQALKASAQEGCGLCKQFFNSYTGEREEAWCHKQLGIDSGPGTVRLGSFWTLDLFIPHGIEGTAGEKDRDISWSDVKSTVSEYNIRLAAHEEQALDYDSPEPDTSTMDALFLCKQWLDECRSSHFMCWRYDGEVTRLPTRLIDISHSSPRLFRTDNHISTIDYATLSHCWGRTKFRTLTNEALDDFQKEIPPEALSKTFRDAIHIARFLGFEYIWIDSLCIIQDNAMDWAVESNMMSHVYKGAQLNIAATSAKDGRGGCFHRREKNWHCQIASRSGHIFGCYPTEFEQMSSNRGGMIRNHHNYLQRRAWVLQERYLSRRTLHFAEGQVFWECDQNPASETYRRGYPSKPSARGVLLTDFNLKRRYLSKAGWSLIVDQYSRGELTESQDKLVALGGLAKLIADTAHDEYVAGLWRSEIETELCWSRPGYLPGYINHGSRITPYVAPTWSWASISSHVSTAYRDPSTKLFIEVCDIQLESDHVIPPQFVSRFGRITRGVLAIRCDLLCAGLLRSSGRVDTPVRDVKWTFLPYPCDDKLDGTLLEEGKSHPFNVKLDCTTLEEWQDRLLYCLPIREPIYYINNRIDVLLIEPTGREQGQYQRVGYFQVEETKLKKEDRLAFLDMARRETLTTPEGRSNFVTVADNRHGELGYFINLV